MLFHKHGLEGIAHKYFPIEDDIAVPWTLTHLLASAEVIKNLEQPPGSATEWWILHQKAEEEVLRGASMRMGMVSTVGRKASSSQTADA